MNIEIIEHITNAKSICIMTGAGVSAESGIPTFRDAQTGFWEKFKAEDLATQEAFNKNPQLVWNWYQWRRQLVNNSKPNAAHKVITKLQQERPNVFIVTQNVDGLHQSSGAQDVIEFHGNIRNNKCTSCKYAEANMDNISEVIPECPYCNSSLRPAVVWFGEPIPDDASRRSLDAVKACDVFLSIGTSSLVHPAAGLAELARVNNAIVIEINPNATPLTSRANYVITESAVAALTQIGKRVFS